MTTEPGISPDLTTSKTNRENRVVPSQEQRTMNKYKIDTNSYITGAYKYALYVKRPWQFWWRHVESFETTEAAKAAWEKLDALPIYLR